MIRPFSRKRLLAVPAVLTLALGGAVLTAVPATAAVGDPLIIVTPADADVFTERTITVGGTGSDGDTVTVSAASDAFTPVTTTVAVGGAWETTVTFPDTAAAAQTIEATQTTGTTVNSDTVNVLIPAPAPVVVEPLGEIVVDEPVDGETLDSREIDFSGSAPAGSELFITLEGVTGPIEIEEDGTFAFTLPFPVILGDTATVTFSGTNAAGTELVPVEVTVNLPPALPAPVIVSPTTGSTVTGPTVTVRGTGTPGETVYYVLVTEDAQSATEETGPVIGADGTFTFTAPVLPGEYALVVILGDAQGEATSLPSEPVVFTAVAAPAPVTPAATAPRPQLAATGAVTDGVAVPAALVILAGLGMVAFSRRRITATA